MVKGVVSIFSPDSIIVAVALLERVSGRNFWNAVHGIPRCHRCQTRSVDGYKLLLYTLGDRDNKSDSN